MRNVRPERAGKTLAVRRMDDMVLTALEVFANRGFFVPAIRKQETRER